MVKLQKNTEKNVCQSRAQIKEYYLMGWYIYKLLKPKAYTEYSLNPSVFFLLLPL